MGPALGRGPELSKSKKAMAKKLTLLVIHCTDTPAGREVSSDDIRHWHTDPAPKGRGWSQVGYSDMIHLDGTVENLVPYDTDDEVDLWEITNGAAGFNSTARHIVYVGGKGGDTRTYLQNVALFGYVQRTIAQHPDIKVAGHHDLNQGKACPSFDVARFLRVNSIPKKNIYKP